MNAEKASKKATPRPIPTPSPTLAPLDSPPEDFDEVSLLAAEVVDCWLDEDVVVLVLVLDVDVAVVEVGKSLAWKLSWNIGAYRTIVRVEVEDSTTTEPVVVSVWVIVTTLGNVTTAESMMSVLSQNAVGMAVECVMVAIHVFPFWLVHVNPLEK
jgi:hypothetical protein